MALEQRGRQTLLKKAPLSRRCIQGGYIWAHDGIGGMGRVRTCKDRGPIAPGVAEFNLPVGDLGSIDDMIQHLPCGIKQNWRHLLLVVFVAALSCNPGEVFINPFSRRVDRTMAVEESARIIPMAMLCCQGRKNTLTRPTAAHVKKTWLPPIPRIGVRICHSVIKMEIDNY